MPAPIAVFVHVALSEHWCVPKAHSSTSEHEMPLPVEPGGQAHVNEPAVSVQKLASKQLCVPAVHSLICVHAFADCV